MLKRLADYLEQLDLALEHLLIGDANNARFGLMLTDNVVEIALHEIALQHSYRQRSWARDKEFKHARELAEALGRHFEAKVKFGGLIGLFASGVGDTISIAHGYRNEVYHIGIQHEELLPALSRFYFALVCEVLANFEPPFMGWSSRDKLPERTKKYFPDHEKDFMPGTGDQFAAACKGLAARMDGSGAELIHTLIAHMARVIDEKDDYIDYLAAGLHERRSRTQVVIDCQAWPLSFTREGQDFLNANLPPQRNVFKDVEWIAVHYPLQFRRDPIPSWRKRLEALRTEKDPHKALKKYQSFMDQTSNLRGWVDEATSALDDQINLEVDRMRGK